MKILYRGGEGEVVEKKSRFIGQTMPVQSEEEALAFIQERKKRYWDARHNCFAYVIGDRHQISRCSDDGEPQGTAGKPMLDVLLGADVHNCVVVVTRYFGGVLLGTGGLVRAYQASVKAGLEESEILEVTLGMRMLIRTDYNGIGKLQYIMNQMHLAEIDTRYTATVEVEVMVPQEEQGQFVTKVTEATSGRAELEEMGMFKYAVGEKGVILFP
jgi:uncharacterized YigZ family protein